MLIDEDQELKKKYMVLFTKLDLMKDSIHNLNHDLLKPLFGIIGMLNLLNIEDTDHIDVQIRDLIMIGESAHSLLDLIEGKILSERLYEDTNSCKGIDRKLSSAIIEINCLYLPMARHKSVRLRVKN